MKANPNSLSSLKSPSCQSLVGIEFEFVFNRLHIELLNLSLLDYRVIAAIRYGRCDDIEIFGYNIQLSLQTTSDL